MFNTVKSKILTIVLSMLIVLSIVLTAFAYFYLKNSKSLIIKSYSYSIGLFVQKVNQNVIKFEDHARDLALTGEMQYQAHNNRNVFRNIMKEVFENYPDSLGGGIWFIPNLEKKYNCIYVFRNKAKEIVVDEQYETPEYDYPNQKWYKEITSKLTEQDNVAWSSPYFEREGGNTYMVTVGSGIYYNNKLVGISTVDWKLSAIVKEIEKLRPTQNSFALFADEKNDYVIATTDPNLVNVEMAGKSLKDVPWYNNNLRKITYITYNNKKYIPYVKTLDNGMILIVCVPKTELFSYIFSQVMVLFFILILISIIISSLLYIALNQNITRPIKLLQNVADKIAAGNLNMTIRINKPEEFAQLASTLDKMTKDILSITKQREKVETELSIAKQIQLSSLPNVFPPYPERSDFDIYASTNPALNVGGDFYDFYFLDENRLLFLVADVSGKGVPAALFMMVAKTIMKGAFQNEEDVNFAIKTINNGVCQNNKYNYFVTMLAGIMDLKKEKLILINCGHNPPLIKRKNGDFEYVNIDSNLVLGAMKDVDFDLKEIDFNSGDEIYIYTDGVTEAQNEAEELYGEKRLKEMLNSNKNKPLKEICDSIEEDIKEYSNGIEQSDDITMLNFKFFGNENTYKDTASKQNYNKFLNWLDNVIKKENINDDIRQKLELTFEEIYTNIFSYAYSFSQGDVEISLNKNNDDITLRFVDWGTPYNPLEKPDPDINLAPEDRPIGGLGIYIAKQLAKSIEYKYENSNILTLKF